MLTLQELKQVVGNREERRKVPSARYLRENDVAVVKQRLIDGAEIIAYQTGYVFYCAGDYGTVFPLFTCRDYVYEAGRKITVVKEDFFDNQPWYVRLILEGEDRLCRNREVREHNNCISVKCIFKFYLARVNSIPVEFTSAWIFPSSFYKILLQMIPCLCRRRIK